MQHHPQPLMSSLPRRRFLRGTLGSVAGLAAWQQGWQRHATVAAQPRTPRGQMTWAFQFSLVPTFFDPAETASGGAFVVLYVLHDALIKPMPDNPMAPSLATAWQESPDGLTYDFQLRQGVTFHNGDPFTAEDVQYSFARYKGTGAGELKNKVKAVEVVTPHRVRFQLHAPWPDFPHSTELRGRACHRSAKASGGEDLQVEEPVSCWDFASFHFHATLAGMLSPTLIGD
jgi:ABC-type transport system substrate-binding protein